jgi:ParB family chromosome partitioning protein
MEGTINLQNREFHPVASIFPMMGQDEYSDLKSDIEQNGLLESIWLDQEGLIVDGRNRYKACCDLGLEPTFRTWDGDGSLI